VASIEIAPGWIDAVQRYVEGLMVNSMQAATNATKAFHSKVVEIARADEDWSSLADNIEVWSADGQLVIGIQDESLVSQATLLEYGTPDEAPNPLFRTLTSAVRDASMSMRDEMESHYGPSKTAAPKVKGMKV